MEDHGYMNNVSNRMRVVDFFCGAGGFSEGFRQQDFKIIMGIDNWNPGLQTHNLNHGLNDNTRDVLEFEDINKILELPDSEIIVGSPPCVSFSLSNKGGNADKSLGIRLIEAYLRVVAVKKHQPGSIMRAWLMENVPNSRNFVREVYTFGDLNLSEWALKNGLEPNDTALKVKNNGDILKASDYGSAQARNRFVCGEIIGTEEFPYPNKIVKTQTLEKIRKALPKPLGKTITLEIIDPNYPQLKLSKDDLTDHYYDTGVYEMEWQRAKNAKLNHPYMGKMSFPENEQKPSRTIMATRSAATREAILYKSELKRTGDGEYRLPTIREAASIMGFPLTYIFWGGEAVKWRQIGNAVCPHLSAALASKIREHLGLLKAKPALFTKATDLDGVISLDSHEEKSFSRPPKKNPKSLFRAHPIKSGNMTVALTNRLPDNSSNSWSIVAFSGTGKKYQFVELGQDDFNYAKKLLILNSPKLFKALDTDTRVHFLSPANLDIANASYHYNDRTIEHPLSLVNHISEHIKSTVHDDRIVNTSDTSLVRIKNYVPVSQLASIFALGKIVSEPRSQSDLFNDQTGLGFA